MMYPLKFFLSRSCLNDAFGEGAPTPSSGLMMIEQSRKVLKDTPASVGLVSWNPRRNGCSSRVTTRGHIDLNCALDSDERILISFLHPSGSWI